MTNQATMKAALFILAILGISWGSLAVPVQKDLASDLREFLDLVPTAEILALYEANKNDPEVQAVIEYIFSEEFKALVQQLEAIPEAIVMMQYLSAAGLPVYDWLTALHELIGLPAPASGTRSTKGLSEILDQIVGLLPLDDIKALYDKKMQTSAEFKELIEKLSSPTFKAIVEAVRANKEVQSIVARLLAVGIDVVKIIQVIKTFFGFNYIF